MVLLALAPGLTTLLVEAAKRVVDRTVHGGLALPSGHTAAATSLLLVLGVLAVRRVRRRVRTAGVAVLAVVTAGGAAVGLVIVDSARASRRTPSPGTRPRSQSPWAPRSPSTPPADARVHPAAGPVADTVAL